MSNLEIFLMNDQPTTCPHCGVRTEWVDLPFVEYVQQHHTCPRCGFEFLVHDDQD